MDERHEDCERRPAEDPGLSNYVRHPQIMTRCYIDLKRVMLSGRTRGRLPCAPQDSRNGSRVRGVEARDYSASAFTVVVKRSSRLQDDCLRSVKGAHVCERTVRRKSQ